MSENRTDFDLIDALSRAVLNYASVLYKNGKEVFSDVTFDNAWADRSVAWSDLEMRFNDLRQQAEDVNRSTWQPIDSAPKDGTSIMAYGLFAGEMYGEYDEEGYGIVTYTGRSDYSGFNWSMENTDYAAVWMNPTHWMPLPTPPNLPTREGEGA